MQRYATIEKLIGETPLQATERLRIESNLPKNIPLSYAGRLDPMASGKLLVLIGEECKQQEMYHALDKEYEFSILFGISSDSGDILGIIRRCAPSAIARDALERVVAHLDKTIELPYPHFSSKTVKGKPLHIWTLENRLHEIDIPIKQSTLYKLSLIGLEAVSRKDILSLVSRKIASVKEVTESSKVLGRNFRREDVLASWQRLSKMHESEMLQLATLRCIASSGTYMRSLAERIAQEMGTCGLAYSIHRKTIGRYLPLPGNFGLWTKRF